MEQSLYRPNVAAIILSAQYPSMREFFLAERIDIQGAWQFPQGGIDEGEEPADALMRELEEEIGTNDVQILAQYPEWLHYDFPQEVQTQMYPFKGQRQRYFLVRLNVGAIINLKTASPEFVRYEFVRYEEIFRRVTHFKREVYAKVLSYFKDGGFL